MKRLILIGFCLLLLGNAHAQDVVDGIAKELSESRSGFPGMRPQIFFSQDKYAPGDTAFFRVFILTEDERMLAERSLLTLEMIGQDGSLIIRQNVSCVTYGAANQILIPDNLAPGHYEVRLFSETMNHTHGLTSNLLIVGEKAIERQPVTAPSISIFVEGGHVIQQSVNRLIVRVTPPPTGEGVLRTNHQKITSFAFDRDGFASVQFVPQQGESYWIDASSSGKPVMGQVAEPSPDKLGLRVYPGPRKTWVLDVMSTPGRPEERVFLLLVSRREIFHAQEVYINKAGKTQIVAAANFFPEGFSELFLVNEWRQVLAYRPVYEKMMNPRTITFSGVPEVVGQRQDIKAILNAKDENGKPVSGAFSVSIIPESTRNRTLVTPDPSLVLHGNPPQVSLDQPKERIEMELMSNPIPTSIIPDYSPLLHRSSLTLSGRVFYSDSTKAFPVLSRMVIYLHKDLIQYDTEIDARGNFTFSKIYDFFGTDWVYYKVVTEDKELKDVKAEWSGQSVKIPVPELVPYMTVDRNDPYGTIRKQKRQIEDSYGYFLKGQDKKDDTVNANETLENEFQDADITIYPKDYTPFETMQELILEIIPSLEFRKRQRDSTLHVTLLTHSIFVAQRYAEGNPLCVIDGWITSDMHYIMSLSPREIVSFKIINEIGKLDRLGNLARNGIIFIQTETPEKTKKDLTAGMPLLEGISPTFSHKATFPKQRRVPDLRSMLYWNPLVRADSTGTMHVDFRTSDVPGNYYIRVMGSTDNGHLVSGEYAFPVKLKR